MKMLPEEYFSLEKMHIELKLLKVLADNHEKERRIKTLSKRIHELELNIETNKLREVMSKIKKHESNIHEKRLEIANRLGLKSLDEYFVDDETYELKHESEVLNN